MRPHGAPPPLIRGSPQRRGARSGITGDGLRKRTPGEPCCPRSRYKCFPCHRIPVSASCMPCLCMAEEGPKPFAEMRSWRVKNTEIERWREGRREEEGCSWARRALTVPERVRSFGVSPFCVASAFHRACLLRRSTFPPRCTHLRKFRSGKPSSQTCTWGVRRRKLCGDTIVVYCCTGTIPACVP